MSEMARLPDKLGQLIDETLGMLPDYKRDMPDDHASQEALPTLLKQCEEICATLESREPEPLRTLHHFACTGGSLLSRCIEAQPNTMLLSEIDPFSTLGRVNPGFAPTDTIRQAQLNLRSLPIEALEATFVGGVNSLYEELRQKGRRLVLRDHTHSHYCTSIDPFARPNVRDVLAKHFSLKSVVTVRHPIDSFISLRKNNWVMYEPDTLEEYCRRYHLFLDAYPDTPIIHYEKFVDAPNVTGRKMLELLDLPYLENWQDWSSLIKVTGDSGRKGDQISPRPRKPLDQELIEACASSAAYQSLCDRLEYNVDTEASPYGGDDGSA